ncbi:MAG: DUF447 domain-containing protein [Pirellula staleyi]
MVIEGIITTENSDGSMHIAPIGPHVNSDLTDWVLKPFQTSATFSNLRKSNRCVFHVIDHSLLMAAAVLGLCNEPSPTHQPSEIPMKLRGQIQNLIRAEFDPAIGWVLESSCRVFALSIQYWDVSQPRANAICTLTKQCDRRPCWGWNRASHSILELSILASRVHMLERSVIDDELARHKIIIEKTAGPNEQDAWELLNAHLAISKSPSNGKLG